MSNKCETCKGSGFYIEQHEMGLLETLACPDCQGTGLIPEREDLHIKYRVFREPVEAKNHPVDMQARWIESMDHPDEAKYIEAEELTRFVFVLVPESDHHARVALAAYAASVELDRPALASDLADVLAMGWGD